MGQLHAPVALVQLISPPVPIDKIWLGLRFDMDFMENLIGIQTSVFLTLVYHYTHWIPLSHNVEKVKLSP
jgi:hypothetical protein